MIRFQEQLTFAELDAGTPSHRPPLAAAAALCAVFLATLSGTATAQSLWALRDPDRAFPTFDTQAREVGDVITILINEATDVENRDEREIRRSDQGSDQYDFTGASTGKLGSFNGTTGFNSQLNTQNRLQGESQYRVERQFLDSISGLIVDRLPNGNLVVAATRHRIVSGDRRTLKVSGIVRPIDIAPDNTIESSRISNFSMCYVGDGPEQRYTKPSWLRRTLNALRIDQYR